MKNQFELSIPQKQIAEISKFEEYGNICGISASVYYNGNLDTNAAIYSLKELYKNNKILKAQIMVIDNNNYYQTINNNELNYSIKSFENIHEFYNFCDKKSKETIHIYNCKLFELIIADINDGHYGFFINIHHIIGDAASVKLIFEEMEEYYNDYLSSKSSSNISESYYKYVESCNSYISSEQFSKDLKYWKNIFTNMTKSYISSFNYSSIEAMRFGYSIPKTLSKKIIEYCSKNNLSLFILFSTIFGSYFCHLCDNKNFNFGTSINLRNQLQQKTIGMFANTMVMSVTPKNEKSWKENLLNTKKTELERLRHCKCNYTLFQENASCENNQTHELPYDIYISCQNVKSSSNIKWHNCGAILESLLINIMPSEDNIIMLQYDYQISKFSEQDIATINKNIIYLLENLIKNDSQTLQSSMNELFNTNYDSFSSLNNITCAPCSYHQEKIWFVDQFERNELYDNGPGYHNIPIVLFSYSKLDVELLKKACYHLVNKHSILNLRIKKTTDGLLQIRTKANTDIEIISVNMSKNELISKCIQLTNNAFYNGIDAELFKFYYLDNSSNIDAVLIVCNFMIFDYVSKNIISKDFINYYMDSNSNTSSNQSLETYFSYSKWQKEKTIGLIKYQTSKWKNKVCLPLTPLELPIDSHRENIHLYKAGRMKKSINKKEINNLLKIAKSNQFEMRDIFLSIFILVLHRFSNSSEINIGTVINNRKKLNIPDDFIGAYSNFVLLSNIISRDLSFLSFTKEIIENYKFALHNSIVPFDKLVMELNPDNDMSRTALFDILFDYQINCDANENFEMIELNLGWGKFDYNLLVIESENNIELLLTYNKLYYSEQTANQLMNGIYSAINNISSGNEKISNIEIITKNDKEQILKGFNTYDTQYNNETIINKFINNCYQHPNKIAVKNGNISITYIELMSRANKISKHIKSLNCPPESIIAIYMDKSIDCICTIFGILMSGCAYLPIEKSLPNSRIQYILNDSKPTLIIYDNKNDSCFNYYKAIQYNELYTLQNDCDEIIDFSHTDGLAYIIYTSGTTGNPKGVLVKHKNICSLIENSKRLFQFSKDDIWTMFHSYNFDFSVWELFGCLLTGGCLILISRETSQDTYKFRNILKTEKVTVLNQTPLAFNVLNEIEIVQSKHELNLKYIIFGGEALHFSILENWIKFYPNTKLINMYGITETTVHVTYKEIKDIDIFNSQQKSNIGRPLPGYNVYILNSITSLLPIGVPGEICVAGTGVSDGYLNNKSLTKQKFIDNPFGNGRLYRSGDLGKWLPNGDIEYLGRIDKQVKIRGFRIELGEVENAINSINYIDNCAVLAIDDDFGSKNLVAYIVSKSKVDSLDVKKELEKVLPKYMIPTYITQIDKIPLSKNGKLDIDSLPKNSCVQENMNNAILSPTESKLEKIFRDVLCINQIPLDGNFFELGGQSIKAIHTINIIEKEFNKRISLKDFFTNPTIVELAKIVDKKGEKNNSKIDVSPLTNKLSMSPLQQSIFYSSIMSNNINYNTPGILYLGKNANNEKIESCIKTIIDRHESFRTSFICENGKYFQSIKDHYETPISFKVIKGNFEDFSKEYMQNFVKPFELDKAPLLRIEVIKDSNNNCYLLFDSHHIIMDGTSINIFLKEFESLYEGHTLKVPKLHYRDYCYWLAHKDFTSEKNYWNSHLSNKIDKINLPFDKKYSNNINCPGNTIIYDINQNLINKIKEIASNEKCTEFMVYLSAFYLLLNKYSHQNEIIIGSPINGRNSYDTNNIIGMFVNTLPFHIKIEQKDSFKIFLSKVRNMCLEVFNNQEYPLEYLIDDLNIEYSASTNPLFDIVFAFQNIDKHTFENGMHTIQYQGSISKYLLSVNIEQMLNKYQIIFEYRTDFFEKSTIEYMIKHYITILSSISNHQEIAIKNINCVTENELRLITQKFNNTHTHYNKNNNIVSVFKEQVKKHPNKIAIELNEEKISYIKLDEESNKISNYLILHGVNVGDFVGLLTDRTINTVIAIFGIIKSGGVYVPIDPNYPKKRIDAIINEANIKLILSNNTNVFNIHLINDILLNNTPIDNANIVHSSNDIAYCIFTSGTSGTPKGVLIQHRCVCNLCNHLQLSFEICETDKILQFSSFVFDASIWELSMSILCGATLVMVDSSTINDVKAFSNYFNKKKITIATFPPNYYLITENLKPRILITAGSSTSESVINKAKGIRYFNAYGPTEATVCATCWEKNDNVILENSNIPIGKPISNVKVDILDDNKNACGFGMPGEIYISGDGLSKGYLNLDELTNEKFITNSLTGKRMYGTGDLGKWTPDGNIVFLGRIDNQIKINGFRIELEEIRQTILTHPKVIDSFTIMTQINNQDTICAYIVSNCEIDTNEIKEFLISLLPNYMIPTYIIQIDKLPVNNSGKVDAKFLPPIIINQERLSKPRNDMEISLCNILKDVLTLEEVGIDDNFFSLGGNSITASKFLYEIEKILDFNIKFEHFFKNPTIRGISKIIQNKKQQNEYIPISEDYNKFVMTDFQKELFVFYESNPCSTAYNMPQIYKFNKKIDKEKLISSLNTIILNQKIFRTNFNIIDDEFWQIVSEKKELDFEILQTSEDMIDFTSFIRPFDLKNGSLLRVRIIRIDNTYDYLFIDIHHIICDGIGMDLFTNILSDIYNNEFYEFSEYQFCDYSEWLKTKDYSNQLVYWKEQFIDIPQRLNLPYDYKRDDTSTFCGSYCDITIEKDRKKKIKSFSTKYGITENIFFLYAVIILLGKICNQKDITVGLPVNCRNNKSTANIIGPFINTIPIRYHINAANIDVMISKIKEIFIDSYSNKDVPFSKIVSSLRLPIETSRNPLFDVVFVQQDNNWSNIKFDDASAELVHTKSIPIKTDLIINLITDINCSKIIFAYNDTLFKEKTIETFIQTFLKIVDIVLEENSEKLSFYVDSKYAIIDSDYNKTGNSIIHKDTIDDSKKEQLSIVSQAFSKILGVNKVNNNDGFFELGGDSIKAIRLVTKIREKGYNIEVADIIKENTVYNIAKILKKESQILNNQKEISGEVPNTPIINNFIDWKLEVPNHYNQSTAFLTNLKKEQLNMIINKIIQHHDILRSIFRNDSLYILPNSDFHELSIDEYWIEDTNYKKELFNIFGKIQESIDLENGPLVKCALFHICDKNIFMICVHHLIIDGISWRIILEDFQNAESQLLHGNNIQLGVKTASYIDWANDMNLYIKHIMTPSTIEYWKWIIKKSKICNRLKFEIVDGKKELINYNFIVSKDATEMLIDISKYYEFRLDDILLGILNKTLNKLYDAKDLVVDIEEHGRYSDISNLDISKTVGWFTNIFPIITQCSTDIFECILSVKHSKESVPNHGIGYTQLKKSIGSLETDIIFNYMGEMDSEFNNIHIFETNNDSSSHNTINAKLSINISMYNKELKINIFSNNDIFSIQQLKTFGQTFLDTLNTSIEELKCDIIANNNSYEIDDLSIINDLNI